MLHPDLPLRWLRACTTAGINDRTVGFVATAPTPGCYPGRGSMRLLANGHLVRANYGLPISQGSLERIARTLAAWGPAYIVQTRSGSSVWTTRSRHRTQAQAALAVVDAIVDFRAADLPRFAVRTMYDGSPIMTYEIGYQALSNMTYEAGYPVPRPSVYSPSLARQEQAELAAEVARTAFDYEGKV